MKFTVHCNKRLVAVDKRENITFDVPFRMTTGTFLRITGKRFMSQLSKGNTNSLTFFTGHENFQKLFSLPYSEILQLHFR